MPLIKRPEKKEDTELKGPPVPKELVQKLDRGRRVMLRDASQRRLALRFERGDHYWYLDSKGVLRFQDTVTHTTGGGKPPHRIRNTYNFVHPIVEGKVSAATQRVPSYEVLPSTTDPEDRSAAAVAEKIALYGYDKWRVRRATVKTVKLALVMGEGFAMPYFDANVGPFVPDPETGEPVGRGEVKIATFSANEVYWEAGCEFDDSPWWCIEQAMPIDVAEQMPGFLGGKLTADASSSDVPTDRRDEDNLVLVKRYLERPCPKYPQGRELVMANGKQIVPSAPYPCKNSEGEILDEPVLHRLSYIVDPEDDRDRGLVFQLIDLSRTINDCWNKLLEWKNRGLNPQKMAPVGSMLSRSTDEPGATNYYRPVGGMKPEWEPAARVPTELFQILDLAIQHLRAIAADTDPQAEPDVAARTVQAVIEQANQRWQAFIADLAELHSRLMRHCLFLVATHYTEPRLVQIKGSFGADSIADFLGSDLRDQVDVRVAPASIEQKTRKAITEETLAFADRGWISPQASMARINGGVGDVLGNAYEYDVRRANLVIQKIKQGPDVLFSTPPRFETITDEMGVQQEMEVPGWLPRKFDNADVWEQVLTTWMKTEEYDRLEPGMQEAAMKAYEVLQQLKMQQQALAMAAQAAMAEQQGAENAAKPQGPVPSPDQKMPDLPPES